MEKAQVVIERTYDAPIERVWTALTDIDQLREWYMPLNDFRAEVGFETRFEIINNKKKWPHIFTVTEVVPNKKLSYEWRFEGFPGVSLLTFELSPAGSGTHLTVTHAGLETHEGDKNPGLEPHNFQTGWNELILRSLPNFLAKMPVA